MTKKRIIITIPIVVVFLISTILGFIFIKKPKEDYVYKLFIENGEEYLYMGMYPQSLKNDNVTVSAEPDADGYYIGSDKQRYYKHTVKFFYEDSNGRNIEDLDLLLAKNGIDMQVGQEYYFKLEHIKWRVLRRWADKTLIVCDNAINALPYQSNASGWYIINEEGAHLYEDADGNLTSIAEGNKSLCANNYKHSELRRFFNNDFYNMAFNKKQKDIIKLITLDNSPYSTGANGSAYLACGDTLDYVFALCRRDFSKYGFLENREKRLWKGSDFAKANGALTYTRKLITDELLESNPDWTPFLGTVEAWARSPATNFSDGKGNKNVASSGGYPFYDDGIPTTSQEIAVVPALFLNFVL